MPKITSSNIVAHDNTIKVTLKLEKKFFSAINFDYEDVALQPSSSGYAVTSVNPDIDLDDAIQTDEEAQQAEYSYAVTKPSTGLVYTSITLAGAALLATGSVVLVYESNKLIGQYNAIDVLKLVSGIKINWGQNVFFSKAVFDACRDLKHGDTPLAFRIAKIIIGVLVGGIATVPVVASEYAESKNLLNTLLQMAVLPMNMVGIFALFDKTGEIGQKLLRKKQFLYELSDSEHHLMKKARRAMLINLQQVWPNIKQGKCLVPYQGSLATKIFITLDSLNNGLDITPANNRLYYGSEGVKWFLRFVTPAILATSVLGFLGSSKQFFSIDHGPISWLKFPTVGAWIAANGVMLPQYGLSILAGLGVANVIGELIFSSSFAEGIFGKIKNFLPNIASLDNKLIRVLLGLGLLSTLILGPFSGATGKILFDKYFPDFSGKEIVSIFIYSSVDIFNMYYYFVVAILQGIAGYYRNYGTDKQRAIAASLDNFKEVLAEIRQLPTDEILHLLIEMKKLQSQNIVISHNLEVDEDTSLLLTATSGNIIEKAVGSLITNEINSVKNVSGIAGGFWSKVPITEDKMTQQTSRQPSRWRQLNNIIDDTGEEPATVLNSDSVNVAKMLNSKNKRCCQGMRCTIM